MPAIVVGLKMCLIIFKNLINNNFILIFLKNCVFLIFPGVHVVNLRALSLLNMFGAAWPIAIVARYHF